MGDKEMPFMPLGMGRAVAYERITGTTLLCQADNVDEIDFKEVRAAAAKLADSAQDNYDSRVPFGTLVLNVTDSCNLRCRYCSRYKTDFAERNMSADTILISLEAAIRQAKVIDEPVVVQFHGGEPSLAIDRIKKAVEQLPKSQLQFIDLRLQTNGTNLTDSLLDFCEKYDVHLGLSIDGPPHINGINRLFSNGTPVASVIDESMQKIRSRIPRSSISCLCVISNANVERADEIFEYILSRGIDDLSVMPLYPDFAGCLTDACEIVPRTEEMVAFSKRIFDIWINRLRTGQIISMPTFQIWFWNLLSSNARFQLANTCCGVGENMLFIDTTGDVFPCGPFSFSPETCMGNIRNDVLQTLLKSAVFKDFQSRAADTITECRACALQGVCRGGCPANSYLHHGNIRQVDPFCDYWKGIIGHILSCISSEPEICQLVPDYSIRL